jgi:hypothetical protein
MKKPSGDSGLIRTQLDEQALGFGAERVPAGELGAENPFAPFLADEPRPHREFLADGCDGPKTGVQVCGSRRRTVAATGQPAKHLVELQWDRPAVDGSTAAQEVPAERYLALDVLMVARNRNEAGRHGLSAAGQIEPAGEDLSALGDCGLGQPFGPSVQVVLRATVVAASGAAAATSSRKSRRAATMSPYSAPPPGLRTVGSCHVRMGGKPPCVACSWVILHTFVRLMH